MANQKPLDESLLTISQAARLLSVHPDTLRRWERQGKITSLRIGSRQDRRFKHEDILALPQNQAVFKNLINPISKPKQQLQTKLIKKTLDHAKWIFFDVGYTLMALFPSRGDIYADIAYKYGYNLNPLLIQQNFDELESEWDKEKILRQPLVHASLPTVSEHYAHFNAEVLLRSGFPKELKNKAIKIGKEIFAVVFTDTARWRIFTDVDLFLANLKKKGKKLAVIENWDNRLNNFISHWKLSRYFDFILAGGSLNLRKPDPRLFALACQKAKTKALEIIHIGDHYADDVLGPKRAGLTPLLFDSRRRYLDKDCLKFYHYQDLLDLM